MPIGNIRNTISKNADSLKEGGAAALGTLILGGSKAEAAMAGVGQAILTKLVGPLGKVVGITAMATKGIYNMTKAWATMGTSAASKLDPTPAVRIDAILCSPHTQTPAPSDLHGAGR